MPNLKIFDSKRPTSKFTGTYCILYIHLSFFKYFVVNKNAVRKAKSVYSSFSFLQLIS